jgi:hypothetical protein
MYVPVSMHLAPMVLGDTSPRLLLANADTKGPIPGSASGPFKSAHTYTYTHVITHRHLRTHTRVSKHYNARIDTLPDTSQTQT